MRILVACEFSGIVRDAFYKRGHDAWSCDLIPTKIPGNHIQGNVLEILDNNWDMMIAHPPCTYLSRAGARWWHLPERDKLADQAANFFFKLRDANIPKIALENPIGQINKRWRYPDQTIQPFQYGHPFSKATCLWLKNLPKLNPTKIIKNYVPLIRSSVTKRKKLGIKQTGKYSGGSITAITFSGIASAMAEQWG